MKRVILRLTGLAVLVVLGLIAIAQAQRGGDSAGAPAEPGRLAAAALRGAKPIPLDDEPAALAAPPATWSAAGDVAADAELPDRPRRAARWIDEAVAADESADASAQFTDDASEPVVAPRAAARNFVALAAGEDQPEPARRRAPIDDDAQPAAVDEPAADDQSNAADDAAAEEPRKFAGTAADRVAPAIDRTTSRFDRRAGREKPIEPDDAGADEPFAPAAASGRRADRSPTSAKPAGRDGTGRPGAAQLEGAQAPALSIEKTAPAEIQVGKPATFIIRVKNSGSVPAQGVEIHDEVPQGTQLIATKPVAHEDESGHLVWDLGPMRPGDEVSVEVQLMPQAEGEIGSVATVHLRAAASARTLSTKPALALEVASPGKVLVGDQATLKIKLSNPGTGAATGVVLSSVVPPQLKHPAGGELEFEVGTLKPGEKREMELVLEATAAGTAVNLLAARGDANLQVTQKTPLEVIAPQLKIGFSGPKQRYLERNATYQISVANPGTAPAQDIELVAVLPKQAKFVEANNAGQYDPNTHSVYWSLEELGPDESGGVLLTVLPQEIGDQTLEIKGRAQRGLVDERRETITISGLAALQFELTDVHDPIEAGGETMYEIRVVNQGTKAATNVRVVATMPPEMKALNTEGPTQGRIQGQEVIFEPLAQLAPKADTTYTVTAQGLKPGDLRIRVQLMTDDLATPITKEESTRVYEDE